MGFNNKEIIWGRLRSEGSAGKRSQAGCVYRGPVSTASCGTDVEQKTKDKTASSLLQCKVLKGREQNWKQTHAPNEESATKCQKHNYCKKWTHRKYLDLDLNHTRLHMVGEVAIGWALRALSKSSPRQCLSTHKQVLLVCTEALEGIFLDMLGEAALHSIRGYYVCILIIGIGWEGFQDFLRIIWLRATCGLADSASGRLITL